jgi:hypothetical protein
MKKELIELLAEMLMEDPDGLEEDLNLPPGTADYQQLTVLQLLLNKKLTSFHFPTDLQVSKGQVTELWQGLMEVRPPDLHTVVWRNNYLDKEWNVRPFLNSLLSVPAVFPNLEVLRLETLKCKDNDLINIADHLTKLRSV